MTAEIYKYFQSDQEQTQFDKIIPFVRPYVASTFSFLTEFW